MVHSDWVDLNRDSCDFILANVGFNTQVVLFSFVSKIYLQTLRSLEQISNFFYFEKKQL